MAVPFAGALVSSVVALLVGGFAIYVGARVVVGVDDYSRAVLGAVGWALTSWIPPIGPVVALVVWVGVLKWWYPEGWGTAAVLGVVAWVAALLVLFVVNAALGVGIGAFGVPGGVGRRVKPDGTPRVAFHPAGTPARRQASRGGTGRGRTAPPR